MKLLYLNTQNKAWYFNQGEKVHLLLEGAALYNVDFFVIPEIRNDIIQRMNMGVPSHSALDPYPHAFMGAQLLNHENMFPKSIRGKEQEVHYSFELGIFCYVKNEIPIFWAEHVLLTPDLKIFV